MGVFIYFCWVTSLISCQPATEILNLYVWIIVEKWLTDYFLTVWPTTMALCWTKLCLVNTINLPLVEILFFQWGFEYTDCTHPVLSPWMAADEARVSHVLPHVVWWKKKKKKWGFEYTDCTPSRGIRPLLTKKDVQWY